MSKTSVICIGDSLTAGYGVPIMKSWTNLLAAHFDIIEHGISGDTTAGMLARCNLILSKQQADYCFIMGGTNDLWFKLPNNTIVANIMAMTRHVLQHNIIPIIGIPTPVYSGTQFTVDESPFTENKHYIKSVQSFQKILIQIMQKEHQLYLDFSQDMPARLFLNDGIHPNEKGHEMMALKVTDLLNNTPRAPK
jgi:lysophospholipase L1-like esterase